MSRVKPTRSQLSVLVPRIRGLRESALWVFIGLSTILFFALASYHPGDPAFSISSDAEVIQNRMGPAGAWFADITYLLLGRPAYLLPVLVLLAGILLFRGRDNKAPLVKPVLFMRAGGVLLLLATSCGLATLHFFAPEMRETAGGIIGQIVGGGFEQVLGLLGATVLLLVLWLASVSLATSISWLAVMDIIGRGVFRIFLSFEMFINQTQIWLAGRKAKQHRQDLVSKSRAKPKPEMTRIEPSFNALPSSERLERERQVPLFEPTVSNELPPLALLDDSPSSVGGYSADALEAMSRLVELKLADFGIEVEPLSFLPPIYATINGITALVLILAVISIKKGNRKRHENLMKFAISLSAAFLIMYVAYHMTSDSTKFGGEGMVKYIYYFILLTHILLSIVIIPFVLITYVRAITNNFKRHKKIAKITFPLWLYVAITGVVVYLMISPYY